MSLKPATDSFKDAALWAFLSNLLVFAGAFAYAFGFLVTAVGTVLYFTYAWGRLKKALVDLSTAGVQIGNAEKGTDYIFYSFLGMTFGALVSLIGVTMTFFRALGALAFGIIALSDLIGVISIILYLLGSIPLGMAVYNFGLNYGSDLMRIAGILIIIPVLSVLGWILAYLEVDNLAAGKVTRFQPPQPAVQVIPEGVGTLNRNGEATVILNSNAYVQIVNASLQGFPGVSFISASPNTLNLGRNVVTIRFLNLPPLNPGTYNIIIFFNNGTLTNVPVNFS